MDDRWRFLYCCMAEHAGTRARGVAGVGKPGAAGRSEITVAKHARRAPRKAAMAHAAPVPQTDTGGWGEDPKAGGRSIAKELGKMAP